MNEPLDLVVLVADDDAYAAVSTLLEKRTDSLRIRRPTREMVSYPSHDSGVLKHGAEFLRSYLHRANHALVVLDREGCGQEALSALEIELRLESDLQRAGWLTQEGQSRTAAVVLDPELEIWVWSRSPHVARILGLSENDLQLVLSHFQIGDNGKPTRPKEAMRAALRRGRRPASASIFEELSAKVSLRSQERAFDKLRRTLQTWFPRETPSPGA